MNVKYVNDPSESFKHAYDTHAKQILMFVKIMIFTCESELHPTVLNVFDIFDILKRMNGSDHDNGAHRSPE